MFLALAATRSLWNWAVAGLESDIAIFNIRPAGVGIGRGGGAPNLTCSPPPIDALAKARN